MDGYVSNLYIILIMSIGIDGKVVYYFEVCVFVFVVIYLGILEWKLVSINLFFLFFSILMSC